MPPCSTASYCTTSRPFVIQGVSHNEAAFAPAYWFPVPGGGTLHAFCARTTLFPGSLRILGRVSIRNTAYTIWQAIFILARSISKHLAVRRPVLVITGTVALMLEFLFSPTHAIDSLSRLFRIQGHTSHIMKGARDHVIIASRFPVFG